MYFPPQADPLYESLTKAEENHVKVQPTAENVEYHVGQQWYTPRRVPYPTVAEFAENIIFFIKFLLFIHLSDLSGE